MKIYAMFMDRITEYHTGDEVPQIDLKQFQMDFSLDSHKLVLKFSGQDQGTIKSSLKKDNLGGYSSDTEI